MRTVILTRRVVERERLQRRADAAAMEYGYAALNRNAALDDYLGALEDAQADLDKHDFDTETED